MSVEPRFCRCAISPHSALTLLAALLMLLTSGLANAAGRIAFVIGNSQYVEITPLVNPVNDANAVAGRLQTLGFELHGGRVYHNLTRRQLQRQIKAFARAADNREMAFFYFAGHGMQFNGDPHLLPVDIPNDDDLDIVQSDALSLNKLLATLNGQAKLTIAVFDACREIPSYRSQISRSALGGNTEAWRGLSRPSVAVGSTLVAYSGGSGQLVADGSGKYSPYTGLLLPYLDASVLEQQRLDVPQLFGEVSYQFRLKYNGQQPEVINQGVGPNRFYLASLPVEPERQVAPAPDRVPRPAPEPVAPLTGRLTVETEPVDARVRIMNIVPKYRAGIELELGRRYDVLVSSRGYESWREDVLLNQAEQVVGVVLKRSVPVLVSQGPAPDPVAQHELYEPVMLDIPGGSFMMGSPASETGRDADESQHRVSIKAFKLSKNEATFEQYDAFARETGRKLPDDEGWGRGKRPVINVSWQDAMAYTEWLSGKTGKRYRLPTEAEWEYAARAGSASAYPWGESIGRNNANCDGCGSRWDDKETAPVGQFSANRWGLHDMHGNVYEWTCSGYRNLYDGAEKRCESRQSNVYRALRGGSWVYMPRHARSTNRLGDRPRSADNDVGFRVAQD